ncbi:MAG: AmmeMemoRadiSam system protein B [Steroidobacter sp.]
MRPTPVNTSVRRPAVAGLFYPQDAGELRAIVSAYLRQTPAASLPTPPKALIVPHAGYVYSGVAAAAAYALVAEQRRRVRRVVLIGPSHRVYLQGAAVPQSESFETPLGAIAIDAELRSALLQRGDVLQSDEPHALEHSLEVQLPFLQTLFENFTLLPIVLGVASPDYVASVLADVWGEEDTLVLASSDLSHYHSYEAAQRIDAATSAAILRYDATLSGDQACGAVAINGLLQIARMKALEITQIMRYNSGDTAGDRARVVGYGAFAIHRALA